MSHFSTNIQIKIFHPKIYESLIICQDFSILVGEGEVVQQNKDFSILGGEVEGEGELVQPNKDDS